jgi:hypothetical protein
MKIKVGNGDGPASHYASGALRFGLRNNAEILIIFYTIELYMWILRNAHINLSKIYNDGHYILDDKKYKYN